MTGNLPIRQVLLSGPEDDQPSEPAMKFRLTYEGELQPTARNPMGSVHKHIRRWFHRQLKKLWATNRFLLEHTIYGNPEAIASQYHMFGHRFVPLVREEASLLCSLDVLFLPRDISGSALYAGDVDNRIKTLIDTLCIPRHQLDIAPDADDDPFFCLLEDNKQVSRFVVETDRLLDSPIIEAAVDHNKVHIVVTVEIRPY
jgi:hypothetical protein